MSDDIKWGEPVVGPKIEHSPPSSDAAYLEIRSDDANAKFWLLLSREQAQVVLDALVEARTELTSPKATDADVLVHVCVSYLALKLPGKQ